MWKRKENITAVVRFARCLGVCGYCSEAWILFCVKTANIKIYPSNTNMSQFHPRPIFTTRLEPSY